MADSPFAWLDEMAAATTGAWAQAAAGSAFHLLQEKQFRRLTHFDQTRSRYHALTLSHCPDVTEVLQ